MRETRQQLKLGIVFSLLMNNQLSIESKRCLSTLASEHVMGAWTKRAGVRHTHIACSTTVLLNSYSKTFGHFQIHAPYQGDTNKIELFSYQNPSYCARSTASCSCQMHLLVLVILTSFNNCSLPAFYVHHLTFFNFAHLTARKSECCRIKSKFLQHNV